MFRYHEMRVKIKSLAAESRIIQAEKRRARVASQKDRLEAHRVQHVRRAARAAQIAYAFLRGREYTRIEGNAKSFPDWDMVGRNVRRFGPQTTACAAAYGSWKDRALGVLRRNEGRITHLGASCATEWRSVPVPGALDRGRPEPGLRTAAEAIPAPESSP